MSQKSYNIFLIGCRKNVRHTQREKKERVREGGETQRERERERECVSVCVTCIISLFVRL